jgi:hypothetical protein
MLGSYYCRNSKDPSHLGFLATTPESSAFGDAYADAVNTNASG